MVHIVALIPAHNEEEGIGATIEALLAQDRVPDEVVVIPNGCTDRTVEIASSFLGSECPLTVYELPKLDHKKSEALNLAWRSYGQDADIVLCVDGDTILPSNAVGDWEREFSDNPIVPRRTKFAQVPLGGSSSKATFLGDHILARLQRAEFSAWIDTALARGYATVIAGTGCAISGEALRQVAAIPGRPGPWSYESQVEDFELTYQIRRLGFHCQISPTVRAYTDAMRAIRALWNQRMKWQVGTVEDLLRHGINRTTVVDWAQQLLGVSMALLRIAWVATLALLAVFGMLAFHWFWLVVVPASFASLGLYSARRIPHRDWKDILITVTIIPVELFGWMRSAWFVVAWVEVLLGVATGKRKDRWQLQYAAEAQSLNK